uniref:EamA domain-containing protein n=1 Tax=Candidatus Methanomethylicus mesodigestus TaxID=1867258 RepID=A0A7C3F0B1_9CREN
MDVQFSKKAGAATGLLISVLIWGISFPVIKVAVVEVDSLLFINLRFLLAAALLVSYSILRRERLTRLLKGRILWIMGVTNGAGFAMEVFGLNFTTATNASLLVNVNIVFMALFSAILLREQIKHRAILGILIGLAGVFLITTDGDLTSLASGSAIGDAIIFVGGIIWAYSMIYNKRAATELGLSSMEVTESMTIISAISLLPFLAFSSFKFNLNFLSVSSILYTAVLCTILGFFLFYKALKTLTVVNTGMLMLLEIVVAIIVSYAFLGEEMTMIGMFGGALIASGILLSS